ncbi:MAG TPA: BtrH N-terminal domain-containing protein [Acidimicrobiia bacterium]|nr:BtrH N-terminal domain-containing protein [Acidimicrobiia bacterium]
MTTQKKLKALVRARMDKTGESYTVARRHVLNAQPLSEYQLRGGFNPETAALANALASRGISDPTTDSPISEALILGLGGGLGAGYILWEFAEHGGERRLVTTAFRNQWQYPDRWLRKTCERLGVPVTVFETGGEKRAAKQLNEALDAGLPAMAFVSTADLPYWHLPEEEAGWLGYTITLYGREDGRFLVDDRNRGRLTVSEAEMAVARGRIPSYKNRLLVPDPAATELTLERLVASIDLALAEQVEHLASSSESFSLPAIRKWARMLTDERNPKAWPRVFADGRFLLRALVSTYESVTEAGILGGNLRMLFVEFLIEAARLTDRDLDAPAAAYRQAAAAWERFAATCLSVPLVKQVVDLNARKWSAVAKGDAGWEEAATVGAHSNRLLQESDIGLSASEQVRLFAEMAGALLEVHRAEVTAHNALAGAIG